MIIERSKHVHFIVDVVGENFITVGERAAGMGALIDLSVIINFTEKVAIGERVIIYFIAKHAVLLVPSVRVVPIKRSSVVTVRVNLSVSSLEGVKVTCKMVMNSIITATRVDHSISHGVVLMELTDYVVKLISKLRVVLGDDVMQVDVIIREHFVKRDSIYPMVSVRVVVVAF